MTRAIRLLVLGALGLTVLSARTPARETTAVPGLVANPTLVGDGLPFAAGVGADLRVGPGRTHRSAPTDRSKA